MTKKTIYNKFDKALIANLPRVLFEGRIIVILNAGEAERAVNYLLAQPILGLDTETRATSTPSPCSRYPPATPASSSA